MPVNNTLPSKKFPMKWHTGEEPRTPLKGHLRSIKVELVDFPERRHVLKYAPQFGLATWEDKPKYDYTFKERRQFITDMFSGKVLPTVMETLGFTFLLSNLDYVDVTHLLRHRSMSFSAFCTGDRDQRHDSALLKSSISTSPFYREYTELVEKCKSLYADMVDSHQISILDARTILPRCLENHYYARVNLRDFIGFLKQRLDRQIQPESDNILAFRMLIEVAHVYPEIKQAINLDDPDWFYVKTAPTDRSSNLYMPETPRNDVFDYAQQWFVYQKERKHMKGGSVFTDLWNDLREEYDNIGELDD